MEFYQNEFDYFVYCLIVCGIIKVDDQTGGENMLIEELKNLAQTVQMQRAEAQTVEVKAAHGGCPKVRDTLSSFSNQNSGGVLLFGLDEKQGFAAVGVYDLQDLQKQVTEQCNQMQPPVRALFTSAEYQGVWICAAEIPAVSYAERPCYYTGAGIQNGSFVRVGDADIRMTAYEIYSYEAYRNHLHDDERIVERATMELLDQNLLHGYLAEKRASRPQFAQMSDAQAYEMLAITRNGIPTLAGVFNFCIYPQGFFPELGITAVVVPGTEIGELDPQGARFLDNKRMEGTIANMFAEAMSFCKRNMRVKTIIDPGTGKRVDQTEYPLNAIREIILNALIHRDYSVHTEGTPIQIYFFADRLEIHSPGGLYGRMTVEQLGVAHPDARNPVLAIMTESLTEAEHRYSGIPTIRKEMREAGLPEPVFLNRQNEFVVILYNKPVSAERNPPAADARDRTAALLAFCDVPRSRKEIADYLGIGTVYHVSKKYIMPLCEQGLLRMTLPETPKSRNQKFVAVK